MNTVGKMGLRLNLKTKLMTTGVANKFKTDEDIEVVDIFCLSESTINRKQYQQFFKKMLRCYDVSMFTTLKIAQALISSVTLNGNESWILKKWDRKGIHTFDFFIEEHSREYHG